MNTRTFIRYFKTFIIFLLTMHVMKTYGLEAPVNIAVFNEDVELTTKEVSFGLSSQISNPMPPIAPTSEVDVMFFKTDYPAPGFNTNLTKDYRSSESYSETWTLKVRLDASIPSIDLAFDATSYADVGDLTIFGNTITEPLDIARDLTTQKLSLAEGDYTITFTRVRFALEAESITAGIGENDVAVNFTITENNESLNTTQFKANIHFDENKLELASTDAITLNSTVSFTSSEVTVTDGVAEVTLTDSTGTGGIPAGYVGNIFILNFNVLDTAIAGNTELAFSPITNGIKDSTNTPFQIIYQPGTITIVDLFIANDDALTIAEDSNTHTVDILLNDTIAQAVQNPNAVNSKTVTSLSPNNGNWVAETNGDITTTSHYGGVVSFIDGTLSYTPPLNFSGVDEFYYLARIDTVGNNNPNDFFTSSAKVTVTVTPINDNPIIADLSALTVDEDATIPAISLVVSDVDTALNQIILTTESNNTDLVTVAIVAGELICTLKPDANGTATISVTADDSSTSNNTSSKQFLLTVTPVNDEAPVLSSINDLEADEDSTFTPITLTATDFDNDQITYSAASDNQALLSVSVINDQLSITLKPNANGTTVITVTATDNQGIDSFDQKEFSVTINPVNDKPTLPTYEDITVSEDSPIPDVLINGSDLDDDDLVFYVTTTNPNLIDVEIVDNTLIIDGHKNQHGTATVTVTAMDGNGVDSFSQQSFDVTISPVNDKPVIGAISDIIVDEDTTVTPVQLSVLEYDNDEIEFSATSNNSDLLNITFIGHIMFIELQPNAVGSSSVTVTVSDSEQVNSSSSATFSVTVNPINDKPVLDEITDINVDEDSTIATITLNATDADGETVTYSATSSDTNILTTAVTDNQLTLTLIPNANGVATITVTATDQNGSDSRDQQTFKVTVNPINDATITQADSYSILENTLLTVTTNEGLLTNDSDVDPDELLTYVTSYCEHGVLSVDVDGSFTYLPGTNFVGVDTFTYAVFDGHSISDDVIVTIAVTAGNGKPVLMALDDLNIPEDAVIDPIALLASDDGDTLSFTAVSSDSDILTATVVDDVLTLATVENMHGVVVITVTVTDDSDNQDIKLFTVTILPIDDAPIIELVDITPEEELYNGGTITIQVTANDVDSDGLEYQYGWRKNGQTLFVSEFSSNSTASLTEVDQNYSTDDFYTIECQVTVRDLSTQHLSVVTTATTFVGEDKKQQFISDLQGFGVTNIIEENLVIYLERIQEFQTYLDVKPSLYQEVVDAVNADKLMMMYQIPAAGWNMISSPYQGWNPSEITGQKKHRQVFTYNTTEHYYEIANSTTNFMPGKSYWIYIKESELDSNGGLTYLVSGTTAETRPTMTIGWNMVGPLEEGEIWATENNIYNWDSSSSHYVDEDEPEMKLGAGYWAFIWNLPELNQENN